MPQLALFASGNGSNVQRLAGYFAGHPTVKISLIVCNNPHAFVLQRAELLGIPARVFTRTEFYSPGMVNETLRSFQVDFLILAGFLWLIPEELLKSFPGRIINIHPALLPKFGGKGMYGHRVHEAVISAGETESGITIHFVNDRYDEGEAIFQAKCPVSPDESPESLAQKIHELEYSYFPVVVEKAVTKTMPR
jgi:phosphoribosylglycinamide formyltransferase-1